MEENFGEFLIRNFWQVKLWQIPTCLLSIYMLRDIVKIWVVKLGESPVIHQLHQDFPLPKIRTIWYM